MICCHGALVRLSAGNRQDSQMSSPPVSVLEGPSVSLHLAPVGPKRNLVLLYCKKQQKTGLAV